MSLSRHYLVNLLAQGASRVLATGSTIAVYIVAARLMTVDEFGRYSLIMAFANVFAVLSQFGTNEAMGKMIVHLGHNEVERFLGNFFSLRIIMGLVVIAIALIAALNARDDLVLALTICALGIPLVAARFFEPIYQVLERPHYAAISSLIYSLSFLGGSVAVLIWVPSPLTSLMAVYIGANLVYLFSSLVLTNRVAKLRLGINRQLLRQIFWLAAPLGPAAFYAILNNRADIFLLSYLSTDHIVGLYSAAYRLVDFFSVVTIILVTPLIPIFSRLVLNNPEDLRGPVARSYEAAAFVAVPFAIATPMVSPWLTQLIFGEAFAEAADLMNILVWIVVLVLFSLLSSSANLALGAIKHGYWSGGIAVAVNVALNLWWIPEYGAPGAAYATLISSGVWYLISQYYTTRELGNILHGKYWLWLIFLNGTLALVLYSTPSDKHLLLMVSAGVGYLFMAALLKLRPMVSAIGLVKKLSGKIIPASTV